MARIARVVAPGHPHHVTQRGNRRQKTFFRPQDYELYKRLLAVECRRAGVEIWCYCLMPNHVHLILVPRDSGALARGIAGTHRRYSTLVNHREGWTGYLWQGRFHSCPLDEKHLLVAARYVLSNPVRAGLAATAAGWPHSSIHAHLGRSGRDIVETGPLACRVGSWGAFLECEPEAEEARLIELHQNTGRPLGDPSFVRGLERKLGRRLAAQPRGRPKKPAHLASTRASANLRHA